MHGLAAKVGAQLHQGLSALFYKQATLTAWARAVDDPLVVGSTHITETGPNVSIDSFDTLYTALAEERENAIATFSHGAMRPDLSKIKDQPTWLDRLLSLSDLSTDLILWRLLRFVVPSQRISIWRGRPTVFVARDNETVRAALPYLLAARVNLRLVPGRVPNAQPGAPLEPFADIDQTARLIAGPTGTDALAAPARLMARVLRSGSRYWEPIAKSARAAVAEIDGVEDGAVLLTNSPQGIQGLAMVSAYRERGLRIAIAEHGVSAGLSGVYVAMRPFSDAKIADRYLVCCENTRRFLTAEPGIPDNRVETIGLPRIVRTVPLRPLQRFLTRRGFVEGRRKVIMYVVMPEQNNQRRLPHSPWDRNSYSIQRKVALDVLPHVDGSPVLKTYPSRRYIDPNPIGSLLPLPAKMAYVDKGDFRFIRAAADVIIVESLMSTLGFVLGAGVPVILLRQDGIEPLPDVSRGLEDAIFVVDTRKPSWASELLQLLNQPLRELQREWQARSTKRAAFLEHFVEGPQNNGKRAASSVINLHSRAA